MSSRILTNDEILSIMHYLQRVVPKGIEDADYLYYLLLTLKQMLDT